MQHLNLTTLQHHIDGFLHTLKETRSEETIGTYQRALRELERYALHYAPHLDLTPERMEQYKNYLIENKQLNPVSISTYLTALRQLMNYLLQSGVISENPAAKIKGEKRHKSPVAVLSESEVDKLIRSIPKDTLRDFRDRLIVRLMLESAMSENELVSAKIEQLKRFSTHYVLFLPAKRRRNTLKTKEETIDIPLALGFEIDEYLEKRNRPEEIMPLFVSHSHRIQNKPLTTRAIRYRVKYWLNQCGIERDDISPHSLRNTAAYLWLHRDKLSLDEVQRRMRHDLISTTKIYLLTHEGATNRPLQENP